MRPIYHASSANFGFRKRFESYRSLFPSNSKIRPGKSSEQGLRSLVSAVTFPRVYTNLVKAFWQHSGDGISSRRAEHCHKAFNNGLLIAIDSMNKSTEKTLKATSTLFKGPRRYQSDKSIYRASSTSSIQTNENSNSNAEETTFNL